MRSDDLAHLDRLLELRARYVEGDDDVPRDVEHAIARAQLALGYEGT